MVAPSIKSYLVGLVLAVSLLLVSAVAAGIYFDARQTIAKTKASLRTLATTMVGNTGDNLANVRQLLDRLAARPLVRQVSPDNCDGVLKELQALNARYANVTYTNLDGGVVCSAVPQPGGRLIDVSKAPWHQKLVKDRTFTVGDPFFGPITGKWVSVAGVPIWNDAHDMIGGVEVPLDLGAFDPHIPAGMLPAGSHYGFFSRDGVLVWRNVDMAGVVGTRPQSEAARLVVQMGDGDFEALASDGVMRFYAAVSMPETGWVAYVGVPVAAITAEAKRRAAIAMAIAAAAIVVLLVFCIGLAGKIIRPVLHLEAIARAVRDGHPGVRAVEGGPRELAAVAREFNGMLDARQQSEARLRANVQASPDALLISDTSGVITMANGQVEALLGYPVDQLVGQPVELLVPEAHRAQHPASRIRFGRGDGIPSMGGGREVQARHKDGHDVHVEINLSQIHTDQGVLIASALRDITERKRAADKILCLGQLYAALSHCNQAIVRCTGEDELFLHICHAVVVFGGMKMAWIGMTDAAGRVKPVACHGDGHAYLAEVEISVDAHDAHGQGPTGTAIRENRPVWLQNFQHDPATAAWHERGAAFGWAASAALPLHRNGAAIGALTLYAGMAGAFDDDVRNLLTEIAGDVDYALKIFEQERRRQEADEKITELAFFDQLTGLPNRTLLQDRLRAAMKDSEQSGLYGALFLIDLDNFKVLNDTLGHDKGDLLLKLAAERLTAGVPAGNTVARFGGDEFIVMLGDLGDGEEAAAARAAVIGEDLRTALSQPFQLGQIPYRCTSSIGVTLFRGMLPSLDDLLKHADLAMYKSKAAGRDAIRFFDPGMEAAVRQRASLEIELREAVQRRQFLLHYQPQVVGEARLMGAEVLVRWQHPQRGMISPAEFIPLAEETGLILPLGQWVLETACSQLASWAGRADMSDLIVAVNVSAHQFRQPDFVDQVLAVLQRTGANPRRLKLELTESLMAENLEGIVEKMFILRAKAVSFSLDDFGTGFSSLSYLKRLPLDQLKIDQSFIRDVLNDPNDAAIAKTIVALAQSLGLGVIAEGVETEAQRDFLANSGCHACQGYFFSRPLPLEEFERFAQGTSWIRPVRTKEFVSEQ